MRTHFKATLLSYLACISISTFAQENNEIGVSEQTLFYKHISIDGYAKSRGVTVEQTEDEGFILTGYSTKEETEDQDIFIYLIKTDFKGDTLWTRTFGKEGDEFGWDVRITTDGGFIIAAQSSSRGQGEIDAELIKVDAEGNEEWSNSYGGDKIDRVFSVQQTTDGGYVAVGITYSFNSVGPNDRDGYLIKANPTGELEWHKTFGEDGYDVGHSITLTSEGGYLITGYGESFASGGKRDVYLVKTNTDGKILWLKEYGQGDDERGIKGLQTKDGGYIAIGFTDSNWDVYMVKTNSEGNESWTRTFGTPDRIDFGYTVKETVDGGYVLIGHSESLDGKKGDILLIKTDSKGIYE